MNENEVYIAEEYKFDSPLLTKKDSIIDSCYRDCQQKYFHTFKYRCIFNIIFTNSRIRNNEIFNLPICGESLGLYEIKKNIKIARQRGFSFNQIKKVTLKIYSHLTYINISFFLKHRIPLCHRIFFGELHRIKNM